MVPYFWREFARKLRRRRPKPGDIWHLDEVFLQIKGALQYLWRAVDQHGVVLDILVQGRRNASAAKRLFKRLLAGLKYKPRRIVTDGLRSYGVAHCEVLPEVRHRTSRYLNNRAEIRIGRRGGESGKCKGSSRPARPSDFSQPMDDLWPLPPRQSDDRRQYRRVRAQAFWVWRQETCVQMTA